MNKTNSKRAAKNCSCHTEKDKQKEKRIKIVNKYLFCSVLNKTLDSKTMSYQLKIPFLIANIQTFVKKIVRFY